jgi:phospholipid/cholesterol/gamma-HCH transport system permease protein
VVEALKAFFIELAALTLFAKRFFREVFSPPFEFMEWLKQSHNIAFRSFILVSITGFIMGLVLVIQSRPSLVEFGAGSYLPALSATSIIREIGPLITSLVCAGNVASSISAELGSMKVTEQIDSMEVAGINPFKYLAVTRILATTFMIPVLVIYADGISLLGSYVGSNIDGEVGFFLYFSQVWETISFTDVVPSFLKTFFFGFAIGLVGCYKGFNSENGTVGVGRAANVAVLVSLMFVILIDLTAVQIASLFDIL